MKLLFLFMVFSVILTSPQKSAEASCQSSFMLPVALTALQMQLGLITFRFERNKTEFARLREKKFPTQKDIERANQLMQEKETILEELRQMREQLATLHEKNPTLITPPPPQTVTPPPPQTVH